MLVGGLLIGAAFRLLESSIPAERPCFTQFRPVYYSLRSRFDDTTRVVSAGDQLRHVRQGTRSVAEYASEVRLLLADSGWNDAADQHAFRCDLNNRIQDMLITMPSCSTLDEVIPQANVIDQRIRQRLFCTLSLPTFPLPAANGRLPNFRPPQFPASVFNHRRGLQARFTSTTLVWLPWRCRHQIKFIWGTNSVNQPRGKLNSMESDRRLRQRICLYCGGESHVIANCKLRILSFK
uniref:Retrotransposon gag domain-containing protein n=1 Tax=Spongospora subterranea TaxID=70186 RepID=A0A0H5QTF8_9EUKA|eukprot:CRZ05215.1 hypothetical protein [Spongospora subterranea]